MPTAIITGSTRGIGLVIARRFLDAGYQVVVSSARAESITEARGIFAGYGERVRLVRADVAQEPEVRALIKTALDQFGSIEVLINNAGIHGPIGPCQANDAAAWAAALATNMLGIFYGCHLVIPHMLDRGFGRILNLSGGGATKPMPMYSAYCASKAAVVRFTETIAWELRDGPITVNAIAPGFIATQIHDTTLAAGPLQAGANYPSTERNLARGGDDPEKAAALALHLASPDCTITGKLISAIFDDWAALRKQEEVPEELYTLRRVDNVFVCLKGQ